MYQPQVFLAEAVQFLSTPQIPQAHLIVADPPYNQGIFYGKQWNDKLSHSDYMDWVKSWFQAAKWKLVWEGNFCVFISDEYAADFVICARSVGFELRNWIIWHYGFGQATQTKWARCKTHILVFSHLGGKGCFYDAAIRVPSKRQLVYKDKRADSRGKVPGDVWDCFPRVCGTFKERIKNAPTQIPEQLIERLISAYTVSGNVVIDPFSGTGTTAAVAQRMDRLAIVADIHEEWVQQTKRRCGL